MTLIEQAARALTDDLFRRYQEERDGAYVSAGGDLREVVIDGQVDMVAVVEAVLKAIREPSDEMARAGTLSEREPSAEDVWQAMIDAALGEHDNDG